MVADLNLIIDEPWNAGTDLAASQAWVAELEGLEADGHDVKTHLARARVLLKQAGPPALIDDPEAS